MRQGYGQFCPIAKATEVLGERWTLLIIRELMLGTTRFSDLQRALSQISPSLLTKRLNELVDAEIAIKKQPAKKRYSEYYLTPAGMELEPIINSIAVWGMRWARGQMSDDELDVELLMFDVCRNLDTSDLPEGETLLHFSFHGLTKFPHWWIAVNDSEKELCVDKPVGEVDLSIKTNVRTLIEVWMGDKDLVQVKREGSLVLEGSSLLGRSMKKWFKGSPVSQIRPAN